MTIVSPEIEREVKVLSIDISALLEKMDRLRAVKKYSTTMRVISYDFVGSELYPYETTEDLYAHGINDVLSEAFAYYSERGSLRENNAHLRLRYRDDSDVAELCFKRNTTKQDGHKTAVEYNFNIPIPAAKHFEKVATNIGLMQVALHEKKRVSYRLIDNDCVCDIDTYPGVPTYVEIEHGDERVIDATIDMLGLTEHEQSTKSGQEFFQMYNINYYSTLTF